MNSPNAYSQIKIEGPSEGEPGEQYQIKVTELKGKDLQILTLKDGLPLEGGFPIFKDWKTDQPVINVFTKKKGLYTIILSVNNDNKTYLVHHTLKLGDPKPEDDNSTPKDQYTEKLTKLWEANKDTQSLALLIQILSVMNPDQYTNYQSFEATLISTADQYLKDYNKIRGIRDAIGDRFIEKCGKHPQQYNKDAVKSVLTETLNILKGLK